MRTARLTLVLIAFAAGPALADDYPPPGFTLASDTFKDNQFSTTSIASSPRKTFRIEQWTKPGDQGDDYETWIVGTADQARLPEIGDSDHVGFASEFSVSPDETWLFRSQKVARGVGAAYLYARRKGLAYRPARPPRLDPLVEDLFARSVGQKAVVGGIVELGAWKGKQLIVTLRGSDLGGYEVVDWRCTVDLASGTVSVSPPQRAANRRAAKRHRPE